MMHTPSELYEKYFGPQDEYFLNEKLFEFPLKESEYTKKENTHISTDNTYIPTFDYNLIEIDRTQSRYHFINNVHFRIYNPEKKPLRSIISRIDLEIGGSIVNSLPNLETMLSNYTHLNLVEPTVQVDDFLHVYLPFIHKQTLLFCQGGYSTIKFRMYFNPCEKNPTFRV
jgi:hypothetical protein